MDQHANSMSNWGAQVGESRGAGAPGMDAVEEVRRAVDLHAQVGVLPDDRVHHICKAGQPHNASLRILWSTKLLLSARGRGLTVVIAVDLHRD